MTNISSQYNVNPFYRNKNIAFKGVNYTIEAEKMIEALEKSNAPIAAKKTLELFRNPINILADLNCLKALKNLGLKAKAANYSTSVKRNMSRILEQTNKIYKITSNHPLQKKALEIKSILIEIKNNTSKNSRTEEIKICDILQRIKNYYKLSSTDLHEVFIERELGLKLNDTINVKNIDSIVNDIDKKLRDNTFNITLTEEPTKNNLFAIPTQKETLEGEVSGRALYYVNNNYDKHKPMITSIWEKINKKTETESFMDKAKEAIKMEEDETKKGKLHSSSQELMKLCTINLSKLLSDDEKKFLEDILHDIQDFKVFRSYLKETNGITINGRKTEYEIICNTPIDINEFSYTVNETLSKDSVGIISKNRIFGFSKKSNSIPSIKEFITLIENYKKCLDNMNKSRITLDVADESGQRLSDYLFNETYNRDYTKEIPGIIIDDEKKKQLFELIRETCDAICK